MSAPSLHRESTDSLISYSFVAVHLPVSELAKCIEPEVVYKNYIVYCDYIYAFIEKHNLLCIPSFVFICCCVLPINVPITMYGPRNTKIMTL